MSARSPISTVMRGLDVSIIGKALREHPELWNENTARTAHVDSPHHGIDDIWVRFAPPGVDGSVEHNAAWYKHVVDVIPVRDLVYGLAHQLHADRIGGVLITRIPPGERVKPHVDRGWHAGYYEKFGVQIRSTPEQAFCFEGIRHVTWPGDVFRFENDKLHWVENHSDEERITMIVCLRLEDITEGAS